MTVVESPHFLELHEQDVREQRANVLEAAALEIEVHGWARGSSRTRDGRTCLLGAIALALGHDDLEQGGLSYAISGEIYRVWGGPTAHLLSWNDTEARSASEVTGLLRLRAAEIREGK